MSYVRELDGQDRPDYKYLRNLFDRLFRSKGFEHDNVFDWTTREFERLSHMDQEHLVSHATIAGHIAPRDRAGRCDRNRRRRTRANAKE